MTFRKNVFVMLTSMIMVLAGSWLVGLPRTAIVDGMTLVVATVALSLLIEDSWRKLLEQRDKYTWQYAFGSVIVLCAIIAFLWASRSVTNMEMVARCALVFLLAVMGGFWFHVAYKRSVQDIEDREQEKWEKARKKVKKAKSPEQATKIIYNTLRYRLVGDHIDGDIDRDLPLAVIGEEILTYKELCKMDEELQDVDDLTIKEQRDTAFSYIQTIVDSMEWPTEEE